MQQARNLKEYKAELKESLDNEFLRTAMDNFAVAYRTARARAFANQDLQGLIDEVVQAKDEAGARMMELFAEFKKNAEAKGVHVHLAQTADEANEIIARIARENSVKTVIKSKSMTAEETHLNHRLEKDGLEITETDLGEWIIQLRHEGPTHMVMPAIHLSRYQVAELFSGVTRQRQEVDIQKLVKVARRELRPKFAQADMGISGANFAIAPTGTLGICTNEGNARLTTTLPRVHVTLVGLEKLLPRLHDALAILKVLPKNATGQAITSYVTWLTGANAAANGPDGRKIMHVVFLDNGRTRIAADPEFAQVLRCVRCGACANVCPVYRLVGGHKYGHVYIGAIGLVLTYFFHGKDKAKNLVQNCLNCGACKAVCAAGIDLPRLVKEVHARILDEDGHPAEGRLLAQAMKSRKLFQGLLRAASLVQRPVTGGTPFVRHLPMFLMKEHGYRALPAVADAPFRDRWEAVSKTLPAPCQARHKVALFAGCAQDFLYPEQLEAACRTMASHQVSAEFPMDQTCCGLPLMMMGEKGTAADVAMQNLAGFEASGAEHILTLCASCASHLKHSYPKLLEGKVPAERIKRFTDRIIDYSSFVHDVLKVEADEFRQTRKGAAYHAPCHLCRGLGVTEAPRELLATAGLDYIPTEEEDVCCGFGGTFSVKFPELSSKLLAKKLKRVAESGASMLVTDCPGCVMQLRGGAEQQGLSVQVRHMAEVLDEQKKK